MEDLTDEGVDAAALVLPSAESVHDDLARWSRESPVFATLLERGSPVAALRQLGAVWHQSGDAERAAVVYRAALSLAPDEAWLWRDLAGAYQAASRADLAMRCVRKALSIDATHANTWLQYAALAESMESAEHAEEGYLRALALDPDLADARFGLGVLHMKAFRFEEAIANLKEVIARGGADEVVHISLGHALYMTAGFAESAQAFEQAAACSPLVGNSLRRYARARTFATIIEGDLERALAEYPALAGSEIEPFDEIARDGFGLLSAYGHGAAALALGKWRLLQNPEDPVQQHLNDAVARKSIAAVPAAYVESYFDSFAAGFDEKLLGVLNYRVPHDLAALVGGHRSAFSSMLDLGCGTGLAGEHLARFGANLTGVDLSAGMLAEAAKRAAYSTLTKNDAIGFLKAHPVAFDLVFAADLLIYFGRIEELIAAVAQATMPGAIFALSIELAADRDFEVLPSGRFAHSGSYLASQTAPYFEIVQQQTTELRLEAGVPVKGLLMVLRRRSSAVPGVENGSESE
jgi:predicted TPR repeat methyltransferase